MTQKCSHFCGRHLAGGAEKVLERSVAEVRTLCETCQVPTLPEFELRFCRHDLVQVSLHPDCFSEWVFLNPT